MLSDLSSILLRKDFLLFQRPDIDLKIYLFDKLHGDVDVIIIFKKVIDPDNIGVIYHRQYLDLRLNTRFGTWS